MTCHCSTFGGTAERQFSAKTAAQDLASYRARGPGATTRLLRDGVARTGALDGTLLDVGSGIGALTFELLDLGATHSVLVDASAAYLAAASEEAARRARSHAMQFVHADFLSVVSDLPIVTVVVLDRVICCYPAYEPLLAAALGRAERCFAFSYPRERWFVQAGVAAENWGRQLTGNPFRAFVHSVAAMERVIDRAGFTRASRGHTLSWSADVYLKRT